VGHKVRVTVIATNRRGSSSATSRPTALIRHRGSGKAAPSSPSPLPTGGLRVVGNHLENGNGHRVVLHGVLRNGPEYACSQGWGMTDGPSGDAEFAPMVGWKINSVFLGLNEDCWLGINGVKSQFSGQNYIDFVKSEVVSAEKYGIYPVIGLFWGDPGTDVPNGNAPGGQGQPSMPDNDHAPLFWEEVADTFKNDPKVIFRLQEEPHPDGGRTSMSAWECWKNGDVQYGASSDHSPPLAPTPTSSARHCSETDSAGHTYLTVGMQSLINIVRGTGASNVIQVPGLAFANMLACSNAGSPVSCGFLDSADGIRVSDPLSASNPQLMADVDLYPDSGQDCDNVRCYQDTFAPVAAVMPLDSGETGVSNPSQPFSEEEAFLSWMDGQRASYYGAAWDTWSTLISAYNGTPKAPFGTYYKFHIAAF
jgi:endoglucanase